MYGDLQLTTVSTGNKLKIKTKVYEVKAHKDVYHTDFIVGFAGTASDMVTVSSYFQYPELFSKLPRVRNLMGLVLTAEQDIFYFESYNKWVAVNEPYAAIGTGSHYALGALAAGLSPKAAVRVAMKHDAFTGMGVKGYRLKF